MTVHDRTRLTDKLKLFFMKKPQKRAFFLVKTPKYGRFLAFISKQGGDLDIRLKAPTYYAKHSNYVTHSMLDIAIMCDIIAEKQG